MAANVQISWAAILLPASEGTTKSGDRPEAAAAVDYPDATRVAGPGVGNAYPTVAQWGGTRLVLRSGVEERLGDNDVVQLRSLHSAKYDPVVVHQVDGATRTLLAEFYRNNATGTFPFTAAEDGQQRTCAFAQQPPTFERVSGFSDVYTATVYLREV